MFSSLRRVRRWLKLKRSLVETWSSRFILDRFLLGLAHPYPIVWDGWVWTMVLEKKFRSSSFSHINFVFKFHVLSHFSLSFALSPQERMDILNESIEMLKSSAVSSSRMHDETFSVAPTAAAFDRASETTPHLEQAPQSDHAPKLNRTPKLNQTPKLEQAPQLNQSLDLVDSSLLQINLSAEQSISIVPAVETAQAS